MEKRLPVRHGMQLSMLDAWWSEMNSASRPVCDFSHTSHTTLANSHKQVPAENNCVHVCVVWARLVKGLGSIRGALSLNLVLMWPMRLLCPLCSVPHYTQPSGALQLCLHPFPCTSHLPIPPFSTNLYVYAHFHFHTIYLDYPASQIIMIQLYVYLSSHTCGEHVRHFSGNTLCHIHTVEHLHCIKTRRFYYSLA